MKIKSQSPNNNHYEGTKTELFKFVGNHNLEVEKNRFLSQFHETWNIIDSDGNEVGIITHLPSGDWSMTLEIELTSLVILMQIEKNPKAGIDKSMRIFQYYNGQCLIQVYSDNLKRWLTAVKHKNIKDALRDWSSWYLGETVNDLSFKTTIAEWRSKCQF